MALLIWKDVFPSLRGAPRQRHKEQVSILCHFNMPCCAGVWSLRTHFTPCHHCSFNTDFCLCRSGGSASSAPHKRRAAHVALYVNGTLFVHRLHMAITPHFNPCLCLGSGTFPVACVQGLAARVAVTASNLEQACSSATRCFECICIETTIGVPDITALYTHSFISSHNKRQVLSGA